MTKPTFEMFTDLIGELGREVFWLMDDTEERDGREGDRELVVTQDHFDKVSAVLDKIEALPYEEEGFVLGAGAKLQGTLKELLLPLTMVPPWEDRPDDLTEAVSASHPVNSKDFDSYTRALELVSNRHGKGSLVALVCHFLHVGRLKEVAGLVWVDTPPIGQGTGEEPEGTKWARGVGGDYSAAPNGTLWFAHDPFTHKDFPSQIAAMAYAEMDHLGWVATLLKEPEVALSPRYVTLYNEFDKKCKEVNQMDVELRVLEKLVGRWQTARAAYRKPIISQTDLDDLKDAEKHLLRYKLPEEVLRAMAPTDRAEAVAAALAMPEVEAKVHAGLFQNRDQVEFWKDRAYSSGRQIEAMKQEQEATMQKLRIANAALHQAQSKLAQIEAADAKAKAEKGGV